MRNVPESNSILCQICGATSIILDVVDFSKSCEEAKGIYLEPCGVPIYYYQCTHCSFTFAPEIQNWSESKFLEDIYNENYFKVDPEYIEIRPRANFDVIHNIFGSKRADIIHLDYGGGNGRFSALLKSAHWNSTSYDPLIDDSSIFNSLGVFNLITAFEVFEHVPRIDKLMSDLSTLSAPDCLVLYSTLLVDGNISKNQRLTWWYASPRNGHISLFSRKSLSILAEKFNFNFVSFSSGLHGFYREIPYWATSILR